jgi:hypothetical protein
MMARTIASFRDLLRRYSAAVWDMQQWYSDNCDEIYDLDTPVLNNRWDAVRDTESAIRKALNVDYSWEPLDD